MKPTLDINGKELKIGDTVNVPEPNYLLGDIHNFEFTGTVKHIYAIDNPQLIMVVDMDGDCWDIEAERVESPEDHNFDIIISGCGTLENISKALGLIKVAIDNNTPIEEIDGSEWNDCTLRTEFNTKW